MSELWEAGQVSGVEALPASGRGRVAVPAGEVARLYGLGLTMGEVARVCGASQWVIASRLDEAGTPRRAPGHDAGLPLSRAVASYGADPGLLGGLAAGLGVPADVISGRAARPARRGRGRSRPDVPVREVADLYRAGWTAEQIAGTYCTARSTILLRLEAARVARRPKSLPASFPAGQAARRVRDDGVSFAALGREYGISAGTVAYHVKARGVAAAVHAPRVLRGVPAADLAALYETGVSLAQIAARYRVSRWAVTARLDAASVPRRPPCPPHGGSAFPVDEAAGLYTAGASLTELAARYGTGAPSVWRRLTAAGVAMRPAGGRRIILPVSQAAGLYEAGATITELAQRYGVCWTVIYNRLTEAGTVLRRKKGGYKQVDTALMTALARQLGLETLP
jgi:uncharacterized protein (DUF433 family)